MKGINKEELAAEFLKNFIGAVCGTVATVIVESALPKLASVLSEQVKKVKNRKTQEMESDEEVIDIECFEEVES